METMTQEQYLLSRKDYIGSSDAPVIMNGFHFERTPFLLWKEKLGLVDGNVNNFATQRGKELEPIAQAAYENYIGEEVEAQVIINHENIKYMRATVDGLSSTHGRCVEIKCPGAPDHEIALSGKVPPKYIAQLQHIMACNDDEVIDYWSFYNGRGVLVEVERDKDYISKLYSKEKEFWDYVISFETPPLNSKDYQEMDLSKEWKEHASQYLEIESTIKKLEESKAKEREALIALAGQHNAMGAGVRLYQSMPKGRVNYNAIPELIGVDLDQYRTPSTLRWTVRPY